MLLKHLVIFISILIFSTEIFSLKAGAVTPADESQVTVGKSRLTQMGYDVDVGFLYLDSIQRLSRPALIQQDSQNLAEESDVTSGYRTVGLQHMKLGLDWTSTKMIRASITLRPDGVKPSKDIIREVDTRSGVFQSKAESIELLDLYELAWLFDTAELSIGVKESSLYSYSRAYKPIVVFSHEPQAIGKSFGAYASLKNQVPISDSGGIDFDFALIGSSGDRHTKRNKDPSSGDEAPSRDSAIWGFALNSNSRLNKNISVEVGTSLFDEHLSVGRASNLLLNLGLKTEMKWNDAQTKVALLAKQLDTKYKNAERDIAPNRLRSLQLSSVVGLSKENEVLISVLGGEGERQSQLNLVSSLKSRAAHFEIGLRRWLANGLQASGIVTREWCRSKFDGEEDNSGCFGAADKRSSLISRAAIQVSYLTGADL